MNILARLFHKLICPDSEIKGDWNLIIILNMCLHVFRVATLPLFPNLNYLPPLSSHYSYMIRNVPPRFLPSPSSSLSLSHTHTLSLSLSFSVCVCVYVCACHSCKQSMNYKWLVVLQHNNPRIAPHSQTLLPGQSWPIFSKRQILFCIHSIINDFLSMFSFIYLWDIYVTHFQINGEIGNSLQSTNLQFPNYLGQFVQSTSLTFIRLNLDGQVLFSFYPQAPEILFPSEILIRLCDFLRVYIVTHNLLRF